MPDKNGAVNRPQNKDQAPGQGDTPGLEPRRFVSGDSRYAEWKDSPAGNCTREALELLARRLTASWPRRGHNLLELYCADGHFLEMFWQSGFDVTGQEESSFLLSQARERLKNAAEFTQFNPAALPYDDDSFDYVVCLAGLEFAEDPAVLVGEMFRLAAKGVLIAFPCSWSLHSLAHSLRKLIRRKKGTGRRFFSPLKISSLINQLGSGDSNWASALLGPAWSWKVQRLWRINYVNFPFPFGAICMVRVDLNAPLGGNQLTVTAKRGFKQETATSSLGRVSKSKHK